MLGDKITDAHAVSALCAPICTEFMALYDHLMTCDQEAFLGLIRYCRVSKAFDKKKVKFQFLFVGDIHGSSVGSGLDTRMCEACRLTGGQEKHGRSAATGLEREIQELL